MENLNNKSACWIELLESKMQDLFADYPIYSQEGKGFDAKVIVKIYDPLSSAVCLITEASKEDGDYMLYGYFHIFVWEWGYNMLSEILSVKRQKYLTYPEGKTVRECLSEMGIAVSDD